MADSYRTFALVIHPDAPASLLSLIAAYLHQSGDIRWAFCRNVIPDFGFVSADLMKEGSSELWPIQIPSGYVLAIADMSQDRPSLGFSVGNK